MRRIRGMIQVWQHVFNYKKICTTFEIMQFLGIIHLNFTEITIGWHIHERLIEADLMSLCT